AALADYAKAIELDPLYYHAYFNRGYAYRWHANDLPAALRDYDQAVSLRPDSPQARCERGGTRARLGDLQGGLEDANHGLQVDPQYACGYYTRGGIYSQMEEYQLAIADYTQFITMVPYAAQDAYIGRGLAYSRSGDETAAIADYSQAIQINPADPLPYNNRGQSYVNLGDYAAARADWTRAAELYRQQGRIDEYQRLTQAISQLPAS
ncbi:MAG: tetratricopeptide repeat protein, partial [Chloroflexaceae bacterium]